MSIVPVTPGAPVSIASAISTAISANIMAAMPNPEAEAERSIIGLHFASMPSELVAHVSVCKQCLNAGNCKVRDILVNREQFKEKIISKLVGQTKQ